MQHIQQSNYTNPAFFNKEKQVYTLPGIFNQLYIEGLTYNDVVQKQDGRTVIVVDDVLAALDPQNFGRNDYTMETFGFSIPIKEKLFFTFNHSFRYHTYVDYPKELPQLLLQGNSQFIGETITLDNDIQITGYHSLGFGFGYTFDNLTIGAKAKFLSGFADATTDDNANSISLYTDPDIYQLTLNSNYILNTASAIDYNNVFNSTLDLNYRFSELFTEPFFSGNTGWAFDLGANYEMEKLSVSASIIDLGRINWNTDADRLTSVTNTQYDGFDISGEITGTGNGGSFQNALDSLEDALDFVKTETTYSSKLPLKTYLSGQYQLTDKYKIGAVYSFEKFRSRSNHAIAIGGNAQFKKWLNVGLTYAIINDRYDNLGTNLTLQTNSFQAFMVTDNIISLFDVGNSQAFGVRFGGSLFF